MYQILKDFTHLLFPVACLACNRPLLYKERVLCTYCLGALPNGCDNDIVKHRFWGKAPIEHAIALFQFSKGSSVQKLLHKVKYGNRQKALYHLGRYCGFFCQRLERNFDVIIPVPLHVKRLQERGYNQSYIFAKGISHTLAVSCKNNWLRRIVNTKTQTKKNKDERFKSMMNAFVISPHARLENKHVLLVDDVITTGATLRVCMQQLLASGTRCISIATLGVSV